MEHFWWCLRMGPQSSKTKGNKKPPFLHYLNKSNPASHSWLLLHWCHLLAHYKCCVWLLHNFYLIRSVSFKLYLRFDLFCLPLVITKNKKRFDRSQLFSPFSFKVPFGFESSLEAVWGLWKPLWRFVVILFFPQYLSVCFRCCSWVHQTNTEARGINYFFLSLSLDAICQVDESNSSDAFLDSCVPEHIWPVTGTFGL